jgi:hypothetical protein
MNGMMRRLAVLAALSLALTACSDDGNSGGDTNDPVAWAEKVCTSVEGSIGALGQPDIDPNDPRKSKDNMVAYLGNIANALDRMMTGIREAGTPPVNDGAQTVDRVTATLGDAKRAVDEAKANLERAEVNDPTALGEAITKATTDLAALGDLQDPTADLESNQQLRDAFDKAAACQRLDGGGSNSTPTS